MKKRILAAILAASSVLMAESPNADQDSAQSKKITVRLPVATAEGFATAMDKIAEVRLKHADRDIELLLPAGDYFFNQPYTITSSNASKSFGRLTVKPAEPNAKVRFVGGAKVVGWRPVKGKYFGRTDVWEANIKELGFTARTRALAINGELQTFCRYPNFNPQYPFAGGWAYVPGKWISMYKILEIDPRDEITIAPGDWHDWSHPQEGELVIYARMGWGECNGRIDSKEVNGETFKLRLQKAIAEPPRPGDRYILRGFREEMDSPGEWHHDVSEGVIRFIPPRGVKLDNAIATVATGAWTLEIVKASNLTIEGIEFCGGNGGVKIDQCSDVELLGCRLHDLAGTAVRMSGRKCSVRDCDIYRIGANAINISGGSRKDPCENLVENCYIHHIGGIERHSPNAIYIFANGARIRHCLLHDLSGAAVHHAGAWHEISSCRIHHYNLECEDMGAMYTGGYNAGCGTIITNNWISDGIGYGKAAGIGPLKFRLNCNGLYFDTDSGGAYVVDNVFDRISGMGMQMNNTRAMVVSNNIFNVCGLPGLGKWSYIMGLTGIPLGDKDGKYEKGYQSNLRNDPSLKDIPAYKYSPAEASKKFGSMGWGNVFMCNIWNYNDPGANYFLMKINPTANTWDNNIIRSGGDRDSIVIKLNDKTIDWRKDWVGKYGCDKNSFVAGKIAFKKPADGDYTLLQRNLYGKLGIRPLDMSKNCGLYPTKYRKFPFKEVEGCARHPEWYSNAAKPKPKKKPNRRQ